MSSHDKEKPDYNNLIVLKFDLAMKSLQCTTPGNAIILECM